MGSIPEQTIEQIAAANDIVEVIGSYVPLKRAGASFKALCPFHQEKTPSFNVSPQRQTFHCFGCGKGGSVFRFLMDYEHLEFPAAVKKLAARVGITVIEEGVPGASEKQQEGRQRLLHLHAATAAWFHENLLKREWAADARAYLKARGISRQVVIDWQIGFAPESWDAFLRWAQEQGFRRPELVQSGLVKPKDEDRPEGDVYDRFRGRIIFPICNDVGEVIAFSGRILEGSGDAAKYLNSPETPLFRKGNVLFGLHKTKRALINAQTAIVCEGQLDLISLFEAGITNVVAPQGTAFTANQARLLRRFVETVVLCFDSDAAGQKAAERSVEPLLEHNLQVRIAQIPAGEDPDSLVRTAGRASFEQLVAEAPDFFEFWIEKEAASEDLASLGGRTRVAHRLASTVARVSDPILRREVAAKAAARLGVPPQEFDELLRKPVPLRSAFDRAPGSDPAPVSVRHDIAMLCLLAIRHAEARAFLLSQNWRDVLSQTPGAQLLQRILEAHLEPGDAASTSAFMAALPEDQEALVSGWLMQKMPENGLDVAHDWWRGLQGATIRRQLQIAEGRIRLPQLSSGEVVALQKQILDLQKQLHELSAFSPVRVLNR